MRGFDIVFWFGAGVLVLLIVLTRAIANFFQLNFMIVFLCSSAVIWVVLEILGKRLLRTSPEENSLIYCEWENRINDLDFDANQDSTISCIEEIGLTLEQTIGKTFSFHTEPNLEMTDLYFEGAIIRDEDNRIVIRALEPLPIN